MINYFFVLDIKNNRVIFSHPRNRKEIYKVFVNQAVNKIQPENLLIGTRGKKRFPSDERILYKKIDEKMMLAAIVNSVKLEAEIYKFFFEFHHQVSNFRPLEKRQLLLDEKKKREMKKFNNFSDILRFQKKLMRYKKVLGDVQSISLKPKASISYLI